jgi:hypothetical protein
MTPDRLLHLFPRAWRERYGDEFLATAGSGPLNMQQFVDIVSAAIDAWLSTDVRNATGTFHAVPSGGKSMIPMTLNSLIACERRNARYTKRDALIGAGVAIGASLLFSMSGIAARRAGWPMTGDILVQVSFPVSWTLSMPFWLMKGQPWKAQVAIVGATLVLLGAAGYLASI